MNDNKINKKDTRQNFIDMLNEYFYVLTTFTRSITIAQKRIEQQLEAGQKIDKDCVLMINSSCTQILETISVILPLMKQNDAFPLIEEQKINKEQIEGDYVIQDPEKRRTVEDLKSYIMEILVKEDVVKELAGSGSEEEKEELRKRIESIDLNNTEIVDNE